MCSMRSLACCRQFWCAVVNNTVRCTDSKLTCMCVSVSAPKWVRRWVHMKHSSTLSAHLCKRNICIFNSAATECCASFVGACLLYTHTLTHTHARARVSAACTLSIFHCFGECMNVPWFVDAKDRRREMKQVHVSYRVKICIRVAWLSIVVHVFSVFALLWTAICHFWKNEKCNSSNCSVRISITLPRSTFSPLWNAA